MSDENFEILGAFFESGNPVGNDTGPPSFSFKGENAWVVVISIMAILILLCCVLLELTISHLCWPCKKVIERCCPSGFRFLQVCTNPRDEPGQTTGCLGIIVWTFRMLFAWVINFPLGEWFAPTVAVFLFLCCRFLSWSDVYNVAIIDKDDVVPILLADVISVFFTLCLCVLVLNSFKILNKLGKVLIEKVLKKRGHSGVLFVLSALCFLLTVPTNNDVTILSLTETVDEMEGGFSTYLLVYVVLIITNFSSALLPTSNPTNLMVTQAQDISFYQYVLIILPAFVVGFTVLFFEFYVLMRIFLFLDKVGFRIGRGDKNVDSDFGHDEEMRSLFNISNVSTAGSFRVSEQESGRPKYGSIGGFPRLSNRPSTRPMEDDEFDDDDDDPVLPEGSINTVKESNRRAKCLDALAIIQIAVSSIIVIVLLGLFTAFSFPKLQHIHPYIACVIAFPIIFVFGFVIIVLRGKWQVEFEGILTKFPFPILPFLCCMFLLCYKLQDIKLLDYFSYYLSAMFNSITDSIIVGAVTTRWQKIAANIVCQLIFQVICSTLSSILNNQVNTVLMVFLLGNDRMQLTIPVVKTTLYFTLVLGSTLGANFTPIGTLAAILWKNLTKKRKLKFWAFMLLGLFLVPPILLSTIVLSWCVVLYGPN